MMMMITGAETKASQAEIDRHLELGKQFLVHGQLSDALTHYHAAVGKFELSDTHTNQTIVYLFLEHSHL